jgi:hypothetical protein
VVTFGEIIGDTFILNINFFAIILRNPIIKVIASFSIKRFTVGRMNQLIQLHLIQNIRQGFKATTSINRFDYGLNWNMLTEGVATVSDEVEIILNLQFAQQQLSTSK